MSLVGEKKTVIPEETLPKQQTVVQWPNLAVVNPVIRLHEADSVVVARTTLLPGTPVANGVIATQRDPPWAQGGRPQDEVGEPVRKYNQIIGFVTQAVTAAKPVAIRRACTD